MASGAPGIRRSLSDIQNDYDNGNRAELENLMRAWQGIKALPPADLQSFFVIGGYHGEPFGGQGATNAQWWGGYCQHGTVLFPTWHRGYLHRLEKALQSIPGCESVMLPFWDECSDDTLNNGIPWALTKEHVELDGVIIENPLRSFVLPEALTDAVQGDNQLYSKPQGYETVRYPLSGLVGTTADQAATAAHNAKFPSYPANVLTLDANIVGWLGWPIVIPQQSGSPLGPTVTVGLVQSKFVRSLDAPDYTRFSNTTSQAAWNKQYPANPVVALENPHNAIHLAVGGWDVPGYDFSPIDGANGDMGENNTAALDPIFYFHHCFIDYTLWIWQRRHGATDGFDIDPSDPGAVYVLGGNNSPPNGADANAPITMETPLTPFQNADGSPMTTNDVINIETQLGYTYGPGSLDAYAEPAGQAQALMAALAPGGEARTVHVAGLDRGKIRGSFVIAAYAEVDGHKRLVDVEPVLSRWNVAGCANCQNHLEATADFRLPAALIDGGVEIQVHTRGGVIGNNGAVPHSAGFVESLAAGPAPPFTVEIR